MVFLERTHACAERIPEHILFSDWERKWRCCEVWDASGRVYRYLKDNGFGREDMIMIHLPRSAAVLCVLLGVWRAGACAVIVDAAAGEDFYSFFYHDSAPRLVIDAAVFAAICAQPPLAGWEQADAKDAAFVVYTSSSTAKPKGCIHEYGDLDLAAVHAQPENYNGDVSQERYGVLAGVYDIGTLYLAINTLCEGGYLHILKEDDILNSETYAEVIRKKSLTAAIFMPHFMNADVLKTLPSLKYVTAGYENLQNVYFDKPVLYTGYGMSESLLDVAYFLVDKPYRITPVGKIEPMLTARLVDETDAEVSRGEIGELIFLNPYFRGYRNLPELTAQTLRGGWFHTGDMGYFDEEDRLVLVGRKADLLKTEQGFVVPLFVQAELQVQNPGAELAVRAFLREGTPHIVVFSAGTLENKDLAGKVADFMLPTDYFVLEKLPRLHSGKLDRVRLEAIFDEKRNGVCGC